MLVFYDNVVGVEVDPNSVVAIKGNKNEVNDMDVFAYSHEYGYNNLEYKIQFKFNDGRENEYAYLNGHRSIMFSYPNIKDDDNDKLNTIEDAKSNYFLPFYLDNKLFLNSINYYDEIYSDLNDNNEITINKILQLALFNKPELKNVFKDTIKDWENPTINGSNYDLQVKTEADIITSVKNFDSNVEILIYSVEVCPSQYSSYRDCVKFYAKDILFSKYYTSNLDNKDYNHILWIADHSYPALDIRKTLSQAGADYDTFLTELKGLYNDELPELVVFDNNTNRSVTWDDLADEYIYNVSQWVIKKLSSSIEGQVGDELVGSEELNKLFKYLLEDREEYANYDKIVYSDKLYLKKPTEKEIYQTTKEYYVYGPYSVEQNLDSINKINVSIDGNSNGISIVNKTGEVINEINPEDNFYIKVMKKNKVTNMKVKLSTSGAVIRTKGAIYTPVNPTYTSFATGGSKKTINIENTYDIVFNPKTGSNNIGIILSIGVVIFLLGYLLINNKTEKIEL